MSESTSLRPCPFCGEAPRIGDKYEGAGQRPSMNYPEIVCDQCGLRTDFGKRGFHRIVPAWNTRVEDAELARLRAENERLRKACQDALETGEHDILDNGRLRDVLAAALQPPTE